MKRIDILYFEGCPNHKPAVEMAKSVIGELGIEAEINEVEVLSPEDAQAKRFLGSPSIHVDGIDVEPSARERPDFGYSCRTYSGKGLPTREMLTAALTGRVATSADSDTEDSNAGCCTPETPTTVGTMRGNHTFAVAASTGSVFAAVVASACCWLPLLLVAFGFSAGSLGAIFETTRPYFLGVAAILLTTGFYFAYFRKEKCEPGSACDAPRPRLRRANKIVLWIATVGVVALAMFPAYVGVLLPSPVKATHSNVSQELYVLRFDVRGMSCEGCSVTLRNALLKVDEVVDAAVDYEHAAATVTASDNSSGMVDALVAAIGRAGYEGHPAKMGPKTNQSEKE